MTWIVLAVVVVLVIGAAVFAVVALNRLRTQQVLVDEALSGVDVQLTRRAELIPNLVETVRGYASHESGTLEAVTRARADAGAASSVEERAAADGQMRQALANLFAVAEAYPDLKASTNFAQLQAELGRTEDQLAFSRQYYNDSVSTLNRLVVTIPWSFFAGPAGVGRAVFYDAPDGNTAPPQVSF